MPPTKSNAGKVRETRGRMGGPAAKAPLVTGMRGRMGCPGGMKGGGMKGGGVTGMKVTGMRVSGMKGSGMKVTGMKGRGQANGQKKIPFKSVKAANKKKKISPNSILSGNKQQDEALLKLRIPLDICSVLPSIKKFTAKTKGTKGQRKPKNMMFETAAETAQQDQQQQHPLFGAIKKRKTDFVKYGLTLQKEARFQGMIWDVAFTPDGDMIVTCSEGAMLCDKDLKIKKNFENMFLPGAIGFFSDGRVLIVDRSSDTVNVYRKNATFIRSFQAGKCPMGMAVMATDEVLVSDTGDKCVRKFDMLGRHLMTIPTKGDNYAIQWPLYLALNAAQDIFVSDVHQQKVLQFSNNGEFRKVLSLKTQGGSSVLRPHGVCVTKADELVVIDTSIDSMEGFNSNGTFLQNLLNPDDGMSLEPKLCKLNSEQNLVAIGGMKGLIRIYEITLMLPPPEPPSTSHKVKSASSSHSSTVVKKEVKEEPMDQ